MSIDYARTTPRVGDKAQVRKTITTADQTLYIGISGNMHPLYVDETHAATVAEGRRLAFELVLGALATHALAEIAGPFRRIAKFRLNFPTPAMVGDTVAAQAQIVEVCDDGTVLCRIACHRDAPADIVALGDAELIELAPGNADV